MSDGGYVCDECGTAEDGHKSWCPWRRRGGGMSIRRLLRMRRSDRLARVLTKNELAYLSRAVFRQRMDARDDQPELASQLDPLISVARMHAK